MSRSGRLPIFLFLASQAALVGAFAYGLRRRLFPLGVPDEWTWNRLQEGADANVFDWSFGLAWLSTYAGFAALGMRAIGRASEAGRSRGVEVRWLAGLAVASVAIQATLQMAAPHGYGLTKWGFALYAPGSNGYFLQARSPEMADPWRFWADYPEWVARQDSLHIGTHPPGLFLAWRAVLGFYVDHPAAASAVVRRMPAATAGAFREISEQYSLFIPEPDRAAIVTVGALTLLACALTVVPLYALVRRGGPASVAWAAATLWPVVPSALMFQPTADAAFALLTTSALALAATGRRWGAIGAGLALAIGMQFTLAYLAAGLIVAIVQLGTPGASRRDRLILVAGTGLGFVALTAALWWLSGANPLVIWWWNQRKHAGFYEKFTRSYLLWNLVNPIELAVGLGLPIAAWMLAGLARAGRATWATLLVLALLQLSGRNLSEVGRLWLPLMPPLVAASARGIDRLGGRGSTLAATIVLVGVQVLVLQATIQVVYEF